MTTIIDQQCTRCGVPLGLHRIANSAGTFHPECAAPFGPFASQSAEILRLRQRVEELENLVQANVQGSGAVNDPVCQWQDISTAPKDGTAVLIWNPSSYQGKGGSFVGIYFKTREYGLQWICHPGYIRAEPTHWMPLPPPPGDRTSASSGAEVSLNQPKALSPSTVSEE